MWMLFRRFKAKINTDVQKEGQEEMESCWPVAQYFYPSDLFVWFYSPIHHYREMFCGNILVFAFGCVGLLQTGSRFFSTVSKVLLRVSYSIISPNSEKNY
jgi:hypothetical protein